MKIIEENEQTNKNLKEKKTEKTVPASSIALFKIYQVMECQCRRLGTWVQNTIYIVFGPLKIQRSDVYFCIQGFLAGQGYFDLFPYRVAIALFGSGCSWSQELLSASTFRSNNWRVRHMSCI